MRASPLRRSILILTVIWVMLWPTSTAHADPPDMYAQSLSISLTVNSLSIDWKIEPGPVIADAVWAAADQDGNGAISQKEAQDWIAPFLAGLSITLDQKALGPLQVQSLHWPASVNLLRTGQDSIEVKLAGSWLGQTSSQRELEVHNSHLESNSLNWFSVNSSENLRFDQPAQDNGRLSLDIFSSNGQTPGSTQSGFTNWNSGIPNLPGFTGSVSTLAGDLAGSAQSQSPAGNSNPIRTALINLVDARQLSPLFLLGAFLLSLVLGSLHALTPGHGKTLVGAYLIGSNGRRRDAVFLGAIVTVTHTGSVVLLGLVTLLASHFILPSLVTPWLEGVSGLLVIGFGISLFINRRKDLSVWLANRRTNGDSPALKKTQGASLGPTEDIPSSHTHDREQTIIPHHTHPQDESAPLDQPHHEHAGHTHLHNPPPERVIWKSLLALGVSGGLVPCPDAIAILLVAVAINRIPFGMLLISAFSIGLALVLIGIGLAMVQGVRLIARSELLTRISVFTPVASALVVSGLGLGLTAGALNSFRFTASIAQPTPAKSAWNDAISTSSPAPFSQMKIVYIAPDPQNRDQLFITSLTGGSATQLTQEASGISGYSISPDHKTILYTVFNPDGSSTIWSIQPAGGRPRLLLSCPQAECDTPEWYPDGRKFVYERLENAQDAALSRLTLWWLDLATGKTQPVFPDQAFPSSAAQFSPDGGWLSYISPINYELVLYHLTNGQSTSLPLGSPTVLPESWSPASNAILFGDQVNTTNATVLHAKIYLLSSGKTIDLGSPAQANDVTATWSPDGIWIAIDRDVTLEDGSSPSNQIWLVKPDGSSAHVLLAEDQVSYSSLAWSPDSTMLLYSRYSTRNPGKFDIYMVNIQTGKQRLLIDGGDLPGLLPQ